MNILSTRNLKFDIVGRLFLGWPIGALFIFTSVLFPVLARSIDDTAEQHYKIGYKLIDENKFDEAEKEFQEAIKIEPNYPEAHLELGFAYQRKGILDKATIEYRKAVRLNPAKFIGIGNLGSVYFQRGLKWLAVKTIEKALEIEPNYADAHYTLSYIYYNIGETTAFNKEIIDKTITHLEEYQSLVPKAAAVKQNRDFLESLIKKRDELASYTLIVVPEKKEDIEKLNFSKETVNRLKDQIDGKNDLEHEIEDRVTLGIDFYRHNELEEALIEFEEILKLDSKNKEALFLSAAIYYKKNLYDQAINQAEIACNYYSSNSEVYIAYDILARSYFKNGDKVKSSEMMTKLQILDAKMAEELQDEINKGIVR